MKDWRKTLITPSAHISEAIKIIDASALQIALVIDDDSRLVGVVTDGDIRRALLKGLSLDHSVHLIMNKDFTAVGIDSGRDTILELMKRKDLRQIPVVDERGCVVDLKLMTEMIQSPERQNWVVLMAGGMGTRLQPLTDDCPKPLLKIGDKPLLATIVEKFMEFGFRRFFVSVNYKAEMIEAFLGDGSRWGVQIDYLREGRYMGTAGALSLLPARPSHALIVMNGDVLTSVNIQHLLDFHLANKAKATMCVRNYHFKFPFGVIKADQHRLTNIEEKPLQRFLVNAGIYVLEPETLDFVPKDSFFDMPSLFEKLIAQGYETAAFPIREYWMDIGRIDDFERANGEFTEIFK